MSLTLLHAATQFIVGASLVATAAFGPPHIKVTQITDRSAAAGAVLKIATEHHTELEDMAVTGRAEGTRNGQRVSLPIAIVKSGGTGQYTVSKQWDAGSAWVLVFTIEQGPRGSHGVAEAMVKVDAQGAILGIEHPEPKFLSKELGSKRITSKEIDAALATIVARR